MMYGKKLGRNPREFAELIISSLGSGDKYIKSANIAGPGFINLYISDEFYRESIAEILSNKERFGSSNTNTGKTANLEWVSANPTGPVHTGHGRQTALGKAIANLLEWTGYKVTREYYYNNAGKQMDNLASLCTR